MKRHLLVACLSVVALAAARPSGGLGMGAGRPGERPSRRAGLHEGAQCTSNFVFTDGSNVYLGQAAHCSGTGGQTDTDGCTAARCRSARRSRSTGASKPGTLVYNSWLHDAGQGRDRRRHLRVQRPRAGQDRPGRRRQGQSVGARLRRPDRRRRLPADRVDRLLVRQLRAARRRHEAEPQAGRRGPERRATAGATPSTRSRRASRATRAAAS